MNLKNLETPVTVIVILIRNGFAKSTSFIAVFNQNGVKAVMKMKV